MTLGLARRLAEEAAQRAAERMTRPRLGRHRATDERRVRERRRQDFSASGGTM
jgi:hypothetical protein